ncbi:hypothetical protein OESDEN_17198 [Oesophagostomum dentatum]|uniref:Uncharacterized protein n=1 Tax=Oesophagostomum dentatum TaxID=61180 RepID=A0A0B1SIT4_OESDE|nr:hypothetical protein OESDEN_17198 [Oesophagostomum dentatum]
MTLPKLGNQIQEGEMAWISSKISFANSNFQYTSVEQISLKKINPIPPVPSAYMDDVQRCVSHKPLPEEKRMVMKLEFGLDKARRELDPCDLSLKRENMKCRVAVDYTSMMFRERLKISVVKKRSLLSFSHGCHL